MEHNAHVIHLITTTPLRKENTLATAKIYELTVTHERNDLNPKESVTATYEGTLEKIAKLIHENIQHTSRRFVPELTAPVSELPDKVALGFFHDADALVVDKHSGQVRRAGETHMWFTDIADIISDLLTGNTKVVMEKVSSGFYQPHEVYSAENTKDAYRIPLPLQYLHSELAEALTFKLRTEPMPVTPGNVISYARAIYDAYLYDADGVGYTSVSIRKVDAEEACKPECAKACAVERDAEEAEQEFGENLMLLNLLTGTTVAASLDEEPACDDCGDCSMAMACGTDCGDCDAECDECAEDFDLDDVLSFMFTKAVNHDSDEPLVCMAECDGNTSKWSVADGGIEDILKFFSK
jgi:hypothetical protein